MDDDDDQTHLEVHELDAEGLAARIGDLFQKLLVIEEKDDESSLTSKDRSSIVSSDIASRLGHDRNSVTLRASDVQSLVEEKKRREAERLAANIVMKEREMFLRAALQLLDQRENGIGDNGAPVEVGNGAGVRKSMSERTKDAIRVGCLRKFSKGTIWHGNSSLDYTWHEKNVELRHGSFTYEDTLVGNPGVLGLFGFATGGSHDKVIMLDIDACICRPVKLVNDSDKGGNVKDKDKDKGDKDTTSKKNKMLLDCVF